MNEFDTQNTKNQTWYVTLKTDLLHNMQDSR